ncbi:MAG: EamA family transporter [Clostridia bacterium]|nr:EamA family transporter [Clostridia bacterium]
MGFFLIFISSILSVSQSVLTKLASTGGRVAKTMSFNLFKTLGAFLLFGLISVWSFKWHNPTVVYALLYGIFQLACNVFGYLALIKGPMALTSLIVTYNVVIPCVYGVAFLGERVRILQYIGFALLALSMLLLKKKDKDVKFKRHWALCTGLTFLCNGINSVILKIHQTIYPGQFRREFMCIALFVGAVVLLIAAVCTKQKPSISEIGFSVPSGIMMAIANFLSLYLSAQIDATVLFPVTTVCSICLNCTLSKIIFKDKFTIMQIFGIILGIISVILIK